MADTSQAGVPFVELTDEEKAVLRECRITSVFFRGVPLGVVSVLALRQAIKYGIPIPGAKRFTGIYYTGLFGFGFLAGIASYQKTCVGKIMKLENSRLADQVRARMTAEGRGAYQRQWQTGNVHHEQQDVDLQAGKPWSGNRFSEPRPPMEDYIPPSVSATSSIESSEEAPPPPSLYFDVDKAKEDKYTSYAELRKKHRERWMPPNISSSGPSRPEQPRRTQQGEPDSRAGSSDAPLSWFDSDDERSNQESGREFGQRSYTRPSYRQGPPPKKNKYGDLIEG